MIWKVDTLNTIKVISDTSNFTLGWMKDDGSSFTNLSNFISFGDNLYTTKTSFDEVGSYILKLSDNDTDLVRYESIEVISGDINYMMTNTKYSSSYNGAYLVFEKEII